jgi:serine/threonine protein kinase
MVLYDLSRIGISGETINTEFPIRPQDIRSYATSINVTDPIQNGYRNEKFIIKGVSYENLGHLASGTYGDVYKVKNTTDNKIYALKRQKFENTGSPRENNKLIYDTIKEAIVNLIMYDTQAAENKYIGDVYKITCDKIDRNEPKDYIRIYTVIEFFEGNTLYGYLSERATDRNIFLEQSTSFIKKIAKNLEELQGSLEFTHGDFHGRNSMITNDGNIKIIDFGFTRIEKDNLEIICSEDFNKNYKSGKDLTVLLYSIFGYSIIAADALYDKTGAVYNMYKDILGDHIFKDDSKNTIRDMTEMYLHLDANETDNTKAYPSNVIIKIDELPKSVETTTQPTTTQALRRSARLAGKPPLAPTRRKGGGFKNRTCKLKGGRTSLAKSHSLSVQRIKSIGKEKERGKPVYDSEDPPLPAEYILNKKRGQMSKSDIIDIFEASPVPHIKTYAKLIAETYMEEKDKSLQLNLLCTLLYFNSSIQKGAFEFYCESYKNSDKNQRMFMVNEIHFNVIKDCISFRE